MSCIFPILYAELLKITNNVTNKISKYKNQTNKYCVKIMINTTNNSTTTNKNNNNNNKSPDSV